MLELKRLASSSSELCVDHRCPMYACKGIHPCTSSIGSVAQLVEQQASNSKVVGLNPTQFQFVYLFSL